MRISASPTVERSQGRGNRHCVPAGYQCKRKAGSCIQGRQLRAGKRHHSRQPARAPARGVRPTAREQRNKHTGQVPEAALQLGRSGSATASGLAQCRRPSLLCLMPPWTASSGPLGQHWVSAAGKSEVCPNTSHLCFIKISAEHWQMLHDIALYYHHC